MQRTADYRIVIWLVGLTQLVMTTDFSIVTVALPSIARDLHLTPTALVWVLSAGALPAAGLLILAGRAADIFGQRRCMLVGLCLFAAGSVGAAAAPSFPVMVAARALQGLGGAILAPANFSLINTLVPAGPPRHKALGVFGVMQGLSLVIGLMLGGFLTTQFGWRAVFLINPPIVALAIFLTLRAVPVAQTQMDREVDVLGAVLITLGAAATLTAVSLFGRSGVSALSATLLAGGLAAFVGFFFVEARAKSPLAPLSIFGRRNFIAANLVGGCLLAGVAGLFVLTSLFMQNGLKFSARDSGLGMMPYAAAVMLAGQVAPWLMAHVPHRRIVTLGMAIYGLGLAMLAVFSTQPTYLLALAPWSVMCAFGSTVAFMAMMSEATADVPADQQGVASAVTFTGQGLSGPLGLTLALALLSGTGGFSAAYAAMAGLVAVGCLLSLFALRAGPPLTAPFGIQTAPSA